MELVLEINNLEKKYKYFNALNGINMHIEKGAIYGLIGKNGAGKTTIIRIICGLQTPTNGTYRIYGVKYNDKNINDTRKRIGAIIETPSIYLDMTAKENLTEQYKIIGLPNYDDINELLELVDLKNTKNKLVKNFSLGMKQRLGIAIALSSNPDFLILDEPINGLDPQGIIEIRELILKLNKQKNITILISSHYLDELSKIATHYGFVDSGKIIKQISAKELQNKLKKRIELKTNNINEVSKHLDNNNISYEVINDKKINIYDKINISKLIIELSKKNCIINEIYEKEETLENYYINLLGGNHD